MTNYFTWKVKATKGTFWATVEGDTQEAAARTLAQVLMELKVTLVSQQEMKRDGPAERSMFVYFYEGQRNVHAGREVWAILGRLAEFEAQEIVSQAAFRDAFVNGPRIGQKGEQ